MTTTANRAGSWYRPSAEHAANPAVLVAQLDGPPVGSQDGFRERFPCLRHPSALAHSLPSRWTVRSSNSRTIGSAGASPARAFRWRRTAAVVGSSLTRKSPLRRWHPRNFNQVPCPPATLSKTAVERRVQHWFPRNRPDCHRDDRSASSRRLASSSGAQSRAMNNLPATRDVAQHEGRTTSSPEATR